MESIEQSAVGQLGNFSEKEKNSSQSQSFRNELFVSACNAQIFHVFYVKKLFAAEFRELTFDQSNLEPISKKFC